MENEYQSFTRDEVRTYWADFDRRCQGWLKPLLLLAYRKTYINSRRAFRLVTARGQAAVAGLEIPQTHKYSCRAYIPVPMRF